MELNDFEFKIKLPKVPEAYGRWVEKEINQLVFIYEVIHCLQKKMVDNGVEIIDIKHFQHDSIYAPFITFDIGKIQLNIHKCEMKDVLEFRLMVKNVQEHEEPSPADIMHIDILCKFGKPLEIVYSKQYGITGIAYKDILPTERLEAIEAIIDSINSIVKDFPEYSVTQFVEPWEDLE